MAKPRPKKPAVGVPSTTRNNIPIFIGAGAVILVLLVIAVLASKPWESTEDDELANAAPYQQVVSTGTSIPDLAEGGTDPAIGMTAPTLQGKTFTGEPFSIEPSGRAKVVMFMAHWCSHCQAELPRIVDWLGDNGDDHNIEYKMIATATSPQKPNYPPARWIKDEKYPHPVMADDVNSSAANAYGLGGYPYMVFLDGQNKVVARTSGEIGMDEFGRLVTQAIQATSDPGSTTSTTAASASTTAPASPAAQ